LPSVYDLYADEGWTHSSPPLRRYWCFYGGVFGPEAALDRLDTALLAVIRRFGLRGEVKWSNLSEQNVECYISLVDTFFDVLRKEDIRYRQMFLDRSFVWLPQHGATPVSELESQFKLYYQFLKHAFGLRYLPVDRAEGAIRINLHLDNHSNQDLKSRLIDFVANLPRLLGREDIQINVTFMESSKSRRLQICDLLMGAAGSHGNQMQKQRRGGRRGMSNKQRVRDRVCRHIYNHLRKLDSDTRNTRAFNWFETTGHDGSKANRYHHKARVWKFIPARHRKDFGWENSDLDAQGNYVKPRYK